MSINPAAIAKVVIEAIKVDGPKALAIAQQVPVAIEFVEDAYQGLQSNQKLAAAEAYIVDAVRQIDPDLDKQWATLWAFLSPTISAIVTIYNLTGFFKKLIPGAANVVQQGQQG